ncbi:hypothetical protein PSAC2689_10520 [Paraburkholderia sacchari]
MSRDLEPGTGPLDGQITFHFGQAGHDMKEEPARRRSGIDGVGEASELNALLLQIADQINQLLDAVAQPIQFPYD